MVQTPAAVERGRARREVRAAQREVNIQWFINEVVDKVSMTMDQRVRLATQLVHNSIIRKLSVPVIKDPKGGRTTISGRSKPGEYPRADTTQLMKTLFMDIRKDSGGTIGYIGTPLDYGAILETRMNRSFLVRGLREELSTVQRILNSPISTSGV